MASLIRQVIALLTFAFLPAIGQAVYERHRIAWNEDALGEFEVTIDQAQAWGDSAIWVDARPDSQYETQHIPGAIQLNEDRWSELLPQTLTAWTPEKRIVVYCSSQSCGLAHEVGFRLRKEAGLTNVYILHGGWEKWQEAHK